MNHSHLKLWNSMEHKTFCSVSPSVFRSCGCWEVWTRVLFELDCCCKPRRDQRFLISGKLMPGLIIDGPLFSGDNIPIIVMTVLLKSRKSSISIFSHVAEGYLLDSSPATIFWFHSREAFCVIKSYQIIDEKTNRSKSGPSSYPEPPWLPGGLCRVHHQVDSWGTGHNRMNRMELSWQSVDSAVAIFLQKTAPEDSMKWESCPCMASSEDRSFCMFFSSHSVR